MTVARTRQLKIKALSDIWAFADLINFEGGASKFGKVHKKLAGFVTAPQLAKPCVKLSKSREKLTYCRRRLLLMPRGHLKSTVCSVLYVLWRVYRNPNIRILVGANLEKLSQAFIRQLRQYLEDPELQEEVWNSRPHVEGRLVPVMDAAGRKRRAAKSEDEEDTETQTQDKKLIWTLFALQVLRDGKIKEPTVLATTVGTRVTGQHYDLLVLDDIVDFDNSATADKLEKLIDWAGDMESVLDPEREVVCGSYSVGNRTVTVRDVVGDEVVVLGTRYTEGDYYDYIMQNMKAFEYRVFTRNIYRNGQNWVKPTNTEEEWKEHRRNYKIGDATGGYIYSEKFSDEYIKRLKARLKPRRWASQYLNTIISQEEQVFDIEKLRYFKSATVEKKDRLIQLRVPGEEAPRVILPIICVDPAISQSKKADNTSIAVGGVDEEGDLFIIDMKVGKFTPDQTVNHIFDLADKWDISKVIIEVVGFQQALVFAMKEKFRERRPLFIVEHNPQGSGKKKERLEAGLQPYFENGKLWLADWMATLEQLQDDITMFPKESAKDDTLDSIDLVRVYGFKVPRDTRKLTRTRRTQVNSRWGGCR